MELSQLIVLRLGVGDGLWWEVEQARATQPASKLVLLVPGERGDLAQRLDAHLPKPARLDEVVNGRGLWTSAVIAFDSGGTPRVSPVGPLPGVKTPPGAPAHHLARAMQAALESVGVRKRAMVMRVNSGMLTTFGKVLLLIPGLVLLIRLLQLIVA